MKSHDEIVKIIRRAMLETQAATGAACGCDTGTAPYVNEFDAILERAEKSLGTFDSSAWDAAIDAACDKAMTVQAGFRGLLKDARVRYQVLLPNVKGAGTRESEDLEDISDAISQGEAIVGTLGDVIRNIAALKGHPR